MLEFYSRKENKMAEITLQDLIEKVRNDLITSNIGRGYPLFFIDEIELEIAVSISAEVSGGLSIKVLEIGPEIGSKLSSQNSHTITIKLSPILTKDEQRMLINEDPRLLAGIKKASQAALRKGGNVGTP
jgi:hypothetical protein